MIDDVDEEMVALRVTVERTRHERDEAQAALMSVLVWLAEHRDGAGVDDVGELFGRVWPTLWELAGEPVFPS